MAAPGIKSPLPGAAMPHLKEERIVRRLSFRQQRTLAQPAEIEGIGFLTGALVHLRFLPAPPCTGVAFVRTDLQPRVSVPARIDQVTGTTRRTTIGRAPQQVELIEHVMAALAGLRIDNCFVELDAPEPPGLDGSARGFVAVLQAAGAVTQPVRREIWSVRESITVRQPGATLTLHPGRTGTLRVSYFLDYGPGAPIDRQMHTEELNSATFAHSLAGCRTFVLEAEATALRQQGLGSRTTSADLLIFGPQGPIENRLRFSNEPARHKLLDLIGDLALFGHDLCGHVVAYRSGHQLNAELVRALTHEMELSGCVTRRRVA